MRTLVFVAASTGRRGANRQLCCSCVTKAARVRRASRTPPPYVPAPRCVALVRRSAPAVPTLRCSPGMKESPVTDMETGDLPAPLDPEQPERLPSTTVPFDAIARYAPPAAGAPREDRKSTRLN